MRVSTGFVAAAVTGLLAACNPARAQPISGSCTMCRLYPTVCLDHIYPRYRALLNMEAKMTYIDGRRPAEVTAAKTKALNYYAATMDPAMSRRYYT